MEKLLEALYRILPDPVISWVTESPLLRQAASIYADPILRSDLIAATSCRKTWVGLGTALQWIHLAFNAYHLPKSFQIRFLLDITSWRRRCRFQKTPRSILKLLDNGNIGNGTEGRRLHCSNAMHEDWERLELLFLSLLHLFSQSCPVVSKQVLWAVYGNIGYGSLHNLNLEVLPLLKECT